MDKTENELRHVVNHQLVERCFDEFTRGNAELFKTLSPGGREYIRELVANSLLSKDTALAEELYAVDYDHKKVDAQTFFTHSDYLGHFKNEIFQAWWPHLLKICDPAQGIFEVIFTGAQGIGKSTVANGLILANRLHQLLCLRDPAKFFGLAKDSMIVLGIYSYDLKSAEDTGFFILRDQILKDSPFFSSLYRRRPKGTDEMVFPKNIVIKLGSQSLHASGKNLFAISVDEMNVMRKGKATAAKAYNLANTVSTRLESRFKTRNGEIPGITLFIGSAGSTDDFIERRIVRINGKKGRYVVRGALWDFIQRINYSGKKFRVQVGTQSTDCKVLDTMKEIGGIPEVIPIAEPDLNCSVIDVPVEHFDSFDLDCESALRNLAGVSTSSYLKLFSNKERLLEVVDASLPKFFDSDVLYGYLQGPVEIANEFKRDLACSIRGSRWYPKNHPEAPRYIHIDLAKNQDMAGICMVHPSRHYNTKIEFEGLYDISKEVEVDFAIALTCGPKKESIDFANIRRLVFALRQWNFWIRSVTFDSWQSEDSIQRLYEAGVVASVLSVDKDIKPYLITRNAVYAHKIKIPNIPVLLDELLALEYYIADNKIDHPEDKSKDLADAFAGSVYSCLVDKVNVLDNPSLKDRSRAMSVNNYGAYLNDLAKLAREN